MKQLDAADGLGSTGKGKAPLSEHDLDGVEGVYAHPAGTAKGKPKYWHRPPPTAAERMHAVVLGKAETLGDELVTAKQLGQPTGDKATADTDRDFAAAVDALVGESKLYRHGAKYGKHPPRDYAAEMLATVRAKAAALVDTPVTAAELGLPPRAKADQKRHFADAVEALVAEGRLFRHGPKLGKHPPRVLPWFEKPPHQSGFKKLADATKKLLDAGGVTLDQVVAALREQLGGAATSPPVVPVSIVPPAVPLVAPRGVPPGLRAILKDAYDELVTFVEFRHRLVELPRLYDEARKLAPDLRPEGFKDELWRMRGERVLELKVLNEAATAKRPELAIWHDDRLYYYAIWN